MFQQLNIRQKLLGIAIVNSVFALIMALVLVHYLENIEQRFEYVVMEVAPDIDAAEDSIKQGLNIARQSRNMLLADSSSEREQAQQSAQQSFTDISKQLGELKNSPRMSPQMRDQLAKVIDDQDDIEPKFAKFAQLAASDNAAAEQYLKTELAKENNEFIAVIDELSELMQQGMQAEVKQALEESSASRQFGLLFSLAIVVVMFIASVLMSGNLVRRILVCRTVATQIAGGDLTFKWHTMQQEKGRDEIGQSLDAMERMQAKLTELVSNIQGSVDQVAAAGEELMMIAHDVTHKVDEQSVAANAMSAAMEEMAASMVQMAHTAQDVDEKAAVAGTIATESSSHVFKASNEMHELTSQVSEAAREVQALGEQIHQIDNIVTVIGGVAEQTNLLALNAAIEAARAGEQGRGFAVVADEVRTLAGRTAASAHEITRMVQQIQQRTSQVVDTIRASDEKAGHGATLAQHASSSIQGIVQQTETVVRATREIARALHEQQQANHEIAHNVERVAEMANDEANAMHGVSAAAEQMSRLAGGLSQLAHQFRIS